jgi:hypothetical protein
MVTAVEHGSLERFRDAASTIRDRAALGGVPEEALLDPPPPGRLWIVGASEVLALQLRFLLEELGVDTRFLDRAPTEAEWAEAGSTAQAVLVDIWVDHGRCVDALPCLLDTARQHRRGLIVVSDVAQDAAMGVIDDVWQLFRPLRRLCLHEALCWAFGPARRERATAPAGCRRSRPTALRPASTPC